MSTTREIIQAALDAEGLRPEKQGNYTIPEEREASVLVASPGDVFTVDRAVRVELREAYLAVETARRERFFFPYERILGLRLLAGRERTAGFGR
jgi:hypothetical protein